jgi:tetratricopeptide (TPR) repeat protein
MRRIEPAVAVLAGSLVLTGICLASWTARYEHPYPPVTLSLSATESRLNDLGGIVLGLRRLAADIAWVQTLQYYGSAEAGQTDFEFENGIGRYPAFLDYCLRATNLDPQFTAVYYYGGAVLGWNLDRLGEAEELLRLGIQRNPGEWRLPQYLAGLAYQKNHDIANLTRFLEGIIQDPECPLMMKALLANIYKKQGLYPQAIRLWEVIYEAGDPSYRHRAIEQVQDINRLMHSHSHRPLDKK